MIKAKKTKLIVGIIVILTIVVYGIFYFRKNTNAQTQPENKTQSVSAQLGNISNTIVGTGTLTLDDATSQMIPSGIEIDEVLVESGDQVSKGDTIATVNKTSVLQAIEQAQDAIEDLDEQIDDGELLGN